MFSNVVSFSDALDLPELVAVDPFFYMYIFFLLYTNVWRPAILRAFVEPF